MSDTIKPKSKLHYKKNNEFHIKPETSSNPVTKPDEIISKTTTENNETKLTDVKPDSVLSDKDLKL